MNLEIKLKIPQIKQGNYLSHQRFEKFSNKTQN